MWLKQHDKSQGWYWKGSVVWGAVTLTTTPPWIRIEAATSLPSSLLLVCSSTASDSQGILPPCLYSEAAAPKSMPSQCQVNAKSKGWGVGIVQDSGQSKHQTPRPPSFHTRKTSLIRCLACIPIPIIHSVSEGTRQDWTDNLLHRPNCTAVLQLIWLLSKYSTGTRQVTTTSSASFAPLITHFRHGL